MSWHIHHGDVRKILKTLPSDHFDACLSDPPYAYSFMNNRWDYSLPSVNVWTELLRVLKPGAHAMLFGGPRTFHRLCVSVEDAGLIPRDLLMYLHAKGFPKSVAIDKMIDRKKDTRAEVLRVTSWIAGEAKRKGITNKQIDAHFGFEGMAGHWTSTKSQPTVPTLPQWKELLRWMDSKPPSEIGKLAEKIIREKGELGDAWYEREVTGKAREWGDSVNIKITSRDSVMPREESARWFGYGTALKPAVEPVILAMKMIDGTFAENVQKWGTGALNIDGCRIGDEEMSSSSTGVPLSENVAMGGGNYAREEGPKKIGRWPSNVVLDEIAAEMLDVETEGASRFFYTTKVSRAEREQGCDDLEDGPQGTDALRDGKLAGVINQQTPPGSKGANSPRAGAGRTGRVKNIHPTLKAIELTRWLALMLLPPPRKDGQPRRILVPFSGAASEMIGCLQAGWDEVIGIEGQAEYIEIAKARITKGGVFSGLLDKKMRKPARERASIGPSRVRKVREG